MIISHDREFLDRCVNQIWEIEERELRAFSGNYSFYKEEKETELQIMVEKYERQQKKVKQLEGAVEKRRCSADKMENFKFSRSVKNNGGICKRDEGSGSARADPTKRMRSAKALEKRVEMILEREKAEMPKIAKGRKLYFTAEENARRKVVLSVKGVTKRYVDQVFPSVDLIVERGSRVALVGKNGCGKSTLLNIMTGLEEPTTGVISVSPSVTIAYYSQEYENLNFENQIIDEVIENKSDQTYARTVLGCIGIEGDKVYQKICKLSIGERSKVALVKAIVSGANLLILDEPTNHLEISAREAIESALVEFEGTIIFVSHDRRFLEALADCVYDVGKGELILLK